MKVVYDAFGKGTIGITGLRDEFELGYQFSPEPYVLLREQEKGREGTHYLVAKRHGDFALFAGLPGAMQRYEVRVQIGRDVDGSSDEFWFVQDGREGRITTANHKREGAMSYRDASGDVTSLEMLLSHLDFSCMRLFAYELPPKREELQSYQQ